MKKLTASIFTVMLGLVAVDANAAITSKKYVDDALATKAAAADVTALQGAVGTHTSQIGTINTTLEGKADSATSLAGYGITDAYTKGEVDTELAKKQNLLKSGTGGNITVNGAGNVITGITADGTGAVVLQTGTVATAEGLEELEGRVDTAEGDITTLKANVATNTGAIAKLNGDATTDGSVAKAIADEVTRANAAYDAKGAAAAAETAAKEYADGLADNYDAAGAAAAVQGALNEYKTSNDAAVALKADKSTIGTVEEGKTVVQMINEAKTAATYDDTEVRGLITTNANAIEAIEASDVMTSGATKAKIDAIATNTAAIETNATEIAKKANTADLNAIATATISAACATGECVLKYSAGVYSWEPIELTYTAE